MSPGQIQQRLFSNSSLSMLSRMRMGVRGLIHVCVLSWTLATYVSSSNLEAGGEYTSYIDYPIRVC